MTLILRNEKNRMKNIYWEHMNSVLIPALWHNIYQKSKNYIEHEQFKLNTIKYAMHVLSLKKQLENTQRQLNLHHTRSRLPCPLNQIVDKPVDEPTISKTTNVPVVIISTTSKTTPSSLPITKSNIHSNTNSSKKIKFTGTNPNTSIANFKEWCKNKEKKIKLTRDEFKQLKINHKFSEDIYNKNCEWFEYIKNNMNF